MSAERFHRERAELDPAYRRPDMTDLRALAVGARAGASGSRESISRWGSSSR
jgi:hypothetical protein